MCSPWPLRVMMVSSINQGLLREAKRRFGFAQDEMGAHPGYDSLVYECERGGRRFILKLRQVTPRRTVSYLMGELDFLEYLSERGARVSRPAKSLDGRYIEALDTKEGEFMAYAVEKVDGRLVDWREWTPEIFEKWGAMLGQLHALAKDYAPSDESYRRRHWHEDEDYNLERGIPSSQQDIIDRGNALLERLRALPVDRDSYGLVHEDLHQWNFFIHEGELTAFDFENCMYDWHAGDFSPVLHNVITAQSHHYGRGEYDYWMGGVKMDTPTFIDYFMSSFMEGYVRENALSDEWIRRIPDFVKRRHLSTYVTQLEDTEFLALPEGQQKADFPWHSIREHAEQVLNDEWVDAIFERFMARV